MALHIIKCYATKGVKLSAIWFGPFIASVGCYRPETIKVVLKGKSGLVSLNLSEKVVWCSINKCNDVALLGYHLWFH